MKAKPKFKVGQVVRINTSFYETAVRYQQITKVWDWTDAAPTIPKFGYTFANGDRCNEKYIKPLTKRELGQ